MIVMFTGFMIIPDPTVKMLALGCRSRCDRRIPGPVSLVPSIMALLGSHAWWMPRWMEPVIPHIQLESSPATEAAAPEPALTGASGDSAERPAGQSRPGPGLDDARQP